MRFCRSVGLFLAAVGLAVSADAQDVASTKMSAPVVEALKHPAQKHYVSEGVDHPTPPPSWGTTQVSWYRLGASELDPDTSGTTYTSTWVPPFVTTYQRFPTGGFPHLIGFGHVPGGALLPQVAFDYCETNSSGPYGTINLYQCDVLGVCSGTPFFSWDMGTFGTGCHATVTLFGGPMTVNNGNGEVLVDIDFGFTDGSESIGSIGFGYTLQVSPAPGSASFGDVPTSDPAFQYIEALVASGVTAGCGGGNYCPDAPLTRRQMAVFIAKALGLSWDGY